MDLDDAYAVSTHIPGGAEFAARWAADARTFRQRLGVTGRARLGLMYGHGTRHAFDLFLPDLAPKGLVVFVHGGYWRLFDRADWSHFATGALDRGWAVAMPSYDLCPRVRVAAITRQIARAITVAANEVPGPVRLAGHSAGGHLVARMLAPGMLPDAVAERIEHVMPISPLADLRPLVKLQMNDDLRIDKAEAQTESPVFQQRPVVPVTVWVGAEERPVFLDQAMLLAEAWRCGHVVEDGKHHFDVLDGLLKVESPMVRRLLTL